MPRYAFAITLVFALLAIQVSCGGSSRTHLQCRPLLDPEPIDASPLPGEDPPGAHVLTYVDGFQDDYLYDNRSYLKVGIRREWGGSIIFYGFTGESAGVNSTNVIDANDTGREVQVAFYDEDRHHQGCAWNASCRSGGTPCCVVVDNECLPSIVYLGWNPVQGGNRCNRGSGIEAVTFTDGALTVVVDPLQWNPNWERKDCSTDACDDAALSGLRSDVRVIQRLRFVRPHVLELEYTLINRSGLDHAPTFQEMPTVYAANGRSGPDLWRMLDSEGTEITIDEPGPDGFFYKVFQSPGGWATLQNEPLTYGVGLYTENGITEMQGWQNRALPFNNFRSRFAFGIPPYGTVRARVYLLVGSHDTIATEAAWLETHLPPFGCLDAPEPEAELSGSVRVTGWALDNLAVTDVDLVVDGDIRTPLTYGNERPDVNLVWPGYPGDSHVGFDGTLDTSTLSACQHLLEIEARDAHGNRKILARRRFSVTR